MGDTSGAGFAANIFELLAKDFDKQPEAVKADRRQLAKKVRELHREMDFNDDDMDAYEALFTLGLAKRCQICLRPYTRNDYHGKDVCE